MSRFRANLRMNKANSIFYQKRYAEAEEEYRRAIEEFRNTAKPNEDEDEDWLGQALMLRALALAKLHDPDRARNCLREGIALYTAYLDRPGSFDTARDQVEFHAKAAEVLDLLGEAQDMQDLLRHANAALESLYRVVQVQSDEIFWESLLGHWQRLPGRKAKAEIALGQPGYPARALTATEGAKGRVLHRQLSGNADKADADALDQARQEAALNQVWAWCSATTKSRRLISIYVDLSGLAVFVVKGEGEIAARWEADFAYLPWLKQRMDIWDAQVQRYERRNFPVVAQGVLSEIGNALWRADPALVRGGDALILVPHKALRNLPLQHAVLPTGDRLGDVFDHVHVYPTLWDFAEGLRSASNKVQMDRIAGCVDPEGNLPFAQLEGWLCCDPGQLSVGQGVTEQDLAKQSAEADVLLLSCHGTFDNADPWNSALNFGTQTLRVMRFVDDVKLPRIVVLGACEAGLNRRSASDEPVSFASILLRRGAQAVLAPLWSVDDLSSSLFLTDFFRNLRQGQNVAGAVARATRALRDLTASAAIDRLTAWQSLIASDTARQSIDTEAIATQIGATLNWLARLQEDDRPWSLLDWGAYQLVGGYTETG